MLYPFYLLITSTHGLDLYKIPEFGPPRGYFTTDWPIALPAASSIKGRLSHERSISDELSLVYDGRVATFIYADHEEGLSILPSPCKPNEQPILRTFDGPCSMGSSRSIGYHGQTEMQPLELRCLAHLTRRDDHPGYVRLERTVAPDPSQSVIIDLKNETGIIEDLSWDEGSGKLCMIYTPDVSEGNTSPRWLLVVNLI